ncbi:sigma-70 family RNA polymerase sigma factor [Inediibacterium massiliense]|uniref:sigma-70 family RNA polymerase sigma factor n=1 Tax=Inediibacterium massiliense TaxID=1658111 RepID=UPI0006B67998|nr:sigma-70 family RNA polymerase sigma factor [Inediibacterium massiliense]
MQQVSVVHCLEDQKNVYKEKELADIFEAYYKRVYNYIYYRVHCPHTTEDLTSQVFEKVMLKINTYSQSESPFEVWLFAIAKNVINDYFRSIKKRKLFSLDGIKELISGEKTPERMVLIEETNDELFKILNLLSPRERNIVALKFGGNLKNKEIANILDITENNVGIILYRTMKKLKKEIKREESV